VQLNWIHDHLAPDNVSLNLASADALSDTEPRLNDADEEKEQIGILSFIARNFQTEQSRRITDEINAYHEPPLNLGAAGGLESP
jgi:hypothetical protein